MVFMGNFLQMQVDSFENHRCFLDFPVSHVWFLEGTIVRHLLQALILILRAGSVSEIAHSAQTIFEAWTGWDWVGLLGIFGV